MFHYNTGLPFRTDVYQILFHGIIIEKRLGVKGFQVYPSYYGGVWFHCFVNTLPECRHVIREKLLNYHFRFLAVPSVNC